MSINFILIPLNVPSGHLSHSTLQLDIVMPNACNWFTAAFLLVAGQTPVYFGRGSSLCDLVWSRFQVTNIGSDWQIHSCRKRGKKAGRKCASLSFSTTFLWSETCSDSIKTTHWFIVRNLFSSYLKVCLQAAYHHITPLTFLIHSDIFVLRVLSFQLAKKKIQRFEKRKLKGHSSVLFFHFQSTVIPQTS